MSRIFRTVLVVAMFAGLLTGAVGTAQASSTPTAGTGVGCSSTRSCSTGSGGALMLTRGHSCTVGLPVRTRGGRWYVVTAGHCVAEGGRSTWTVGGVALGKGYRWEYGGRGTEGARGTGDIGLLQMTRKSRSQVVVISRGKATTRAITSTRDARRGERVCITGGRTGATQCGTVVATTTSLRYASPGLAARTITNLALVKGVCVNPGDSGSPVFVGRTAVGITVAKSASGCYAWYSKLPGQLKHFGLTVG